MKGTSSFDLHEFDNIVLGKRLGNLWYTKALLSFVTTMIREHGACALSMDQIKSALGLTQHQYNSAVKVLKTENLVVRQVTKNGKRAGALNYSLVRQPITLEDVQAYGAYKRSVGMDDTIMMWDADGILGEGLYDSIMPEGCPRFIGPNAPDSPPPATKVATPPPIPSAPKNAPEARSGYVTWAEIMPMFEAQNARLDRLERLILQQGLMLNRLLSHPIFAEAGKPVTTTINDLESLKENNTTTTGDTASFQDLRDPEEKKSNESPKDCTPPAPAGWQDELTGWGDVSPKKSSREAVKSAPSRASSNDDSWYSIGASGIVDPLVEVWGILGVDSKGDDIGKPIPRSPMREKIEKRIKSLGGVDAAKEFYEYVREKGGEAFLTQFAWKDCDGYCILCNGAVTQWKVDTGRLPKPTASTNRKTRSMNRDEYDAVGAAQDRETTSETGW